MFRKLQWQLTGIFTLLLAVVLAVANIMVYLLLAKTNDQRLASDIESVLRAVEGTSWITNQEPSGSMGESVGEGSPKAALEQEDGETGQENDESPQASQEEGLGSMDIVVPYSVSGYPYYSIKDLNNKTIIQNALDKNIIPYLAPYEQQAMAGSEPVLIDLTKEGKGYYLMVKGDVAIENRVYGHVIVAQNITLAFDTLQQLKRVMLIAMVIEVLVSFGLAYLLAGRFIKPVKQAYLMKEQFIGDASHELRTPLSIMALGLDYLKTEGPRLSGEGQDTLADVREETGKMSQLIERLLLMARHDGKTLIVSRDMVDLREVIEKELDSRKALINQKALAADLGFLAHMFIVGDHQLIEMAIGTVLDNAVKYNMDHGYIRIRGETEHQKRKAIHHLVFENSGETVGPEDLEKIFERFYRKDESRSKKNQGYGLGLAMAKNIVEIHKGKIWAESIPERFFRIHMTFTA